MKKLILSLISLLLINYIYANDTLVIKTSIQKHNNHITLNINFKYADTVTKSEKPVIVSDIFSTIPGEEEVYNKDSLSNSIYNAVFNNNNLQPYINIPENIQNIIDLIKDEKDRIKAYYYLLSDNKYTAIRIANKSNSQSINKTTYRNIEFCIDIDIRLLKNTKLTIEPILMNLYKKNLYTTKTEVILEK